MTHPIESWDIAIPSLGIYTTLTKVPCGQWVNDFGTSGVMRMTYFGAQNKKRIPRFDVSMASNDKSYVLCTMDLDGNWLNAREEVLDVNLTPTIWNVMRRLDALEGSAYANVNAAIQSVQDSEKRLNERVATLEEQCKKQSEYVFHLVSTQQQHCTDAVKKVEAMVADMEKNLRALHDTVVKDVVTQMSMSADTAILRLDAKIDKLAREIEAMKSNTLVKKENDQEEEAAKEIRALEGTLGRCLVRNNDMQKAIEGLTTSVNSLQRDLDKLVAQEVTDSPEITTAQLEPGGVTQCLCSRKRLRR